jgi:hypothetical protein
VEYPLTERDDASHSSTFADMLYLISATVCFTPYQCRVDGGLAFQPARPPDRIACFFSSFGG